MVWKMLIQHFKLFFKSIIECVLFILMLLSTTIGLTFFLTVPSEVYFTFTFVVRCIVYERNVKQNANHQYDKNRRIQYVCSYHVDAISIECFFATNRYVNDNDNDFYNQRF